MPYDPLSLEALYADLYRGIADMYDATRVFTGVATHVSWRSEWRISRSYIKRFFYFFYSFIRFDPIFFLTKELTHKKYVIYK
jgi:hypothetical protein